MAVARVVRPLFSLYVMDIWEVLGEVLGLIPEQLE
jgi:hypothetical protein